MVFEKGTLWKKIVRTTEDALCCGALVPVPTKATFIEDEGIHFFVRVLSHLHEKDAARKKQEAEAKTGRKTNPFLPPEKELTVAELSDTHSAVLNKFNVVEHHLLIITNHYEDQETLLTLRDFEALALCMNEYDSLGFYNGGREAGASQEHKHLQIVPLPLTFGSMSVPIAPFLAGIQTSGPCRIPQYPFLHFFSFLHDRKSGNTVVSASEMFDVYCKLLRSAGMNAPEKDTLVHQSRPYCLLVTRDWMLLVPRLKEYFEGISFNSLAFAGSFFVRNEEELTCLKSSGFLKALQSVAFPLR